MPAQGSSSAGPQPSKQGDQQGAAHSPGVDHSASNAARQLKRSKNQAAKVQASKGNLFDQAFPQAEELASGKGIGIVYSGPVAA